jgi:hypothetical protein
MFLAVRNSLDPRTIDAALDQIVTHGIGSARAESEVVFPRTPGVGVALDADVDARVTLQPRGLKIEHGARFSADLEAVEIEIDQVAGLDHEISRGPRNVAFGDALVADRATVVGPRRRRRRHRRGGRRRAHRLGARGAGRQRQTDRAGNGECA